MTVSGQALLDLVPSKAPGWLRLSEADFGVVMIELMCYVADRLSYYQDRVANEAFLETASIGFQLNPISALSTMNWEMVLLRRPFVHVDAKEEALSPKGFAEGLKVNWRNNDVATMVTPSSLLILHQQSVFETDEDGYISPILNSIKIYHGSNRKLYS